MQLALDSMEACRKAGVMDEGRTLRASNAELEAQRRMMLVSMAKIEETARRLEVIAHRSTGLRPELEIPNLAYHSWAAKFKLRDVERGIYHTTGYECWRRDCEFYKWFMKRHKARMGYRERKSCQESSIIKPATRWEDVRAAAAA